MTMASLDLIEKNVIKGSSGEDNTIRPKAARREWCSVVMITWWQGARANFLPESFTPALAPARVSGDLTPFGRSLKMLGVSA
jgi:hypothetical protein